MRPLLERPFAIFGHSMGSWLGLEVVRRLEASGEQADCLFASGRQAPSLGCTQPPMAYLGDADFVHEVQTRYGGIPDEILAEPDLLALLLPALRADIAALENYEYAAGQPVDTPIVAIVGKSDSIVPVEHVAPWREETRGRFAMHALTGGHFYFQEHPGALLTVMGQQWMRRELTIADAEGAAR
jgi:surfactin synthase thioesterase subunit